MSHTSLKDFLANLGTSASLLGNPTGISKKAFSFFGLFKIPSKNPIGAGVCVNVAKPE